LINWEGGGKKRARGRKKREEGNGGDQERQNFIPRQARKETYLTTVGGA